MKTWAPVGAGPFENFKTLAVAACDGKYRTVNRLDLARKTDVTTLVGAMPGTGHGQHGPVRGFRKSSGIGGPTARISRSISAAERDQSIRPSSGRRRAHMLTPFSGCGSDGTSPDWIRVNKGGSICDTAFLTRS